MVAQNKSSCFFDLFVRKDGDPEQPGQGPGGEQDEAAEQAGSQVVMMLFWIAKSLGFHLFVGFSFVFT